MPNPVVYYATRSDRPGQVKIGTTISVPHRMLALRTARGRGDVTLLAVEPGGEGVERARHLQFAPMRMDGEWFAYGAPIIAHVMDLDQAPVPFGSHSALGDRHRMPVGETVGDGPA